VDQVSFMAASSVHNQSQVQQGGSVHDRLYSAGVASRQKKQHDRTVQSQSVHTHGNEQDLREREGPGSGQKELTFKPNINRISQKIAEAKGRSQEHYMLDKKNSSKLMPAPPPQNLEEYPFHPDINEISNKIYEEKQRMKRSLTGDKFTELHDDWKTKQEKNRVMVMQA
jgi:hypothetical protein